MTATVAGESFDGMDSGFDYSGDLELLEGLVHEVNNSLERLAEINLQGGGQDSARESQAGAESGQVDNVLRFLPKADVEDLAQRVSAIEGLLLK
ncbi:MAG: hypothetical protein HQL70_03800 [Magnetococcales bacterium]|nr:hypothetical protein [Magnetococcales bacterium]